MSIFECPVPGCGRRFKDESVLSGHIKRRHKDEKANVQDVGNEQIEIEQYHAPETIETKEPEQPVSQTAEEDDDKLLTYLKQEMKKLERPEDVTVSMNDIIESQKKLTEKFLLEKSGCSDLEDITQLILREENLYHFDDTADLAMDQLSSLEYLALSHNKLTIVSGISKLVNLIELNINFNMVEDITPLNECLNLEKLYASNNKIRHITGIKDLTRLKCLGLYRNRISNFDDTVKVLSTFTELKELDLDGNECTRRFTYKYDLLFHVKVEKLDGERINPIDYELAKSFKKEKHTESEKEQEADAPSGGLQRPSTAPGRVRPGTSGTFVNRLKKGIQFGANENLMNIPENVNSEKVAELEQELEAFKSRVNELEVELERSKGNEMVMKLENEKLTNQLAIMKVEANNAYILMDNNQQLTREIQSMKSLSRKGLENRDLAQENFLLHEQIMELVKEKNELKAQLDRRIMNEEHPIDRFNRKTEALKITTRQSSTSQDTKEIKDQKPKTINVRSGQMSPSFRISTGTSPRVLLRGASSEAKRNEAKMPSGSQKGSARKIVKLLPPRQGSISRDEQAAEDQDQELSDTEIEDLLIRSSLQISALRSELRNFDFSTIEQEARRRNQTHDDYDEAENIPVDDDDLETRDTSMTQGLSSKRLF